ncbi:tripartite tricarboxylate transporter TctB family protein [Elioraea sp.]|uniref:tripartite tricarboxylate transporter TctB family protein n=1 Tax=Elioraea sp. TaxID=2185103 RepID=UPI003F6F7001
MADAGGGGHGGVAALAGASRTPVADLGLALGVALFAGVLWWQSGKVPPPFFDPLGSAAVPRGIAITLAVLAVLVAVRAVLGLGGRVRGGSAGYRPRPDIALGIILLAVTYLGVMHLGLLGFELASIAFLVAASALLGRFERRTVALGVALALILGIGGTWLFTGFFYIDLPR